MINNERPITAYERDNLEFIRTKFNEALEQRIKNQQKHKSDMNPARKDFREDLHKALIEARAHAVPIYDILNKYADRLIELARRVINEE